ncbi:MAG: hypothetical protein ACYSWU_04575 [Planctomycetota bacterium]|jgi:hypothetical protein
MCTAVLLSLLLIGTPAPASEESPESFRRPKGDTELRYWLGNMVWHHRFTEAEISAATGLSAEEIRAALARFAIRPESRPPRDADAPLLALPYPGGRHPRIGFLDGAIRPQRETKISVFAPWSQTSYVVVDVPEAIWHDTPDGRELLYLAHTHIPTTWTRQGIELERLEWRRHEDGTLSVERRLPNGVVFGTKIVPGKDAVRMEMWLTNGTEATLTGLDVQNCVMLKGAAGFCGQTDKNKLLRKPYTACRSADGKRWVITAWEPCGRVWANAEPPCMHSDPRFPDCRPGQTRRLRGWLSFYQGTDIQAELRRIEGTGWREREKLPRQP